MGCFMIKAPVCILAWGLFKLYVGLDWSRVYELTETCIPATQAGGTIYFFLDV